MAGGKARGVFGQFGQSGLLGLHGAGGFAGGGIGGVKSGLIAVGGLGQFARFPIEPCDCVFGIFVERAFTVDVVGQLGDARLQRVDRAGGLFFALGQTVTLNHEALHEGGCDGLFFAHGGQLGLGLFAGGLGFAGGAVEGGGIGEVLAQGLLHAQFIFGRVVPTAIEQQAFGAAQLFAQGAVAGGLTGLTGKLGQLVRQLFDNIIDAAKVCFGPAQFQFGLMAALVQARDASGLFQNAAARFGARVDQFGDLALTDKGGRMGPGRGIGEQHLHVAGAHILGVHLVGAADVTGDAAGDFQRVAIVEPGGRKALGIVDMQADFGEVAGRARGGAGENHIFHAAAAHGCGAVFAHDPAQRFEQVGLAAAVGADNAGQPVGHDQIGRVNEGFEAVQSEPCEAQRSVHK